MRKVLLSLAAAVAMGAAFTITSANAAPVSPSGLAPSIEDTSMVQDVQRRCWHRWNSRWRCVYRGYRVYRGHGWRGSRWR